ncbi:MAG: hypothetical protein K0R62_6434 [Nonomuraea muscovyensis]|nr:hypothetical protein [Nonomuraea muscovyensis]
MPTGNASACSMMRSAYWRGWLCSRAMRAVSWSNRPGSIRSRGSMTSAGWGRSVELNVPVPAQRAQQAAQLPELLVERVVKSLAAGQDLAHHGRAVGRHLTHSPQARCLRWPRPGPHGARSCLGCTKGYERSSQDARCAPTPKRRARGYEERRQGVRLPALACRLRHPRPVLHRLGPATRRNRPCSNPRFHHNRVWYGCGRGHWRRTRISARVRLSPGGVRTMSKVPAWAGRLRTERTRRGWSQRDLAVRLSKVATPSSSPAARRAATSAGRPASSSRSKADWDEWILSFE